MRFSRIACHASLEDRRGECKRSQDGGKDREGAWSSMVVERAQIKDASGFCDAAHAPLLRMSALVLCLGLFGRNCSRRLTRAWVRSHRALSEN